MKKPVAYPYGTEKKTYDLDEILTYIKKKHKMNYYDFHGSDGHFEKWCDAKGLGKVDPEGKKRSASNIWFKAYQTDSEGEAACPPYEDFWGSFMRWEQPDYTEEPIYFFTFSVDLVMEDEKTPPTTKQFLEHIRNEFGEDIECFIKQA